MKDSKINDTELIKYINTISNLSSRENEMLKKISDEFNKIANGYEGRNKTRFFSDSGLLNYHINIIINNREKCVSLLSKVVKIYKTTAITNAKKIETMGE